MGIMDGQITLVTGATSGIGKEIARSLATLGAHVGIVGRDHGRTEAVAHEIRGEGSADVLLGDLASLDQVRTVAHEILSRYPRIDVFVSNAGVYRIRRSVTADGYEETFAVNHLAPFLLINLLLDRLKESSARIVLTASGAHQGATLDFDDLLLERSYGHWRAYSRSKLANIMFTYALARRLDGTGVTVNCFHPGFVASSLGKGNGFPVRPFYLLARPFAVSPQKGAETGVWLATAKDVAGVSGKYFYKRREARSNAASHDEDAQERLWKDSARLTGI